MVLHGAGVRVQELHLPAHLRPRRHRRVRHQHRLSDGWDAEDVLEVLREARKYVAEEVLRVRQRANGLSVLEEAEEGAELEAEEVTLAHEARDQRWHGEDLHGEVEEVHVAERVGAGHAADEGGVEEDELVGEGVLKVLLADQLDVEVVQRVPHGRPQPMLQPRQQLQPAHLRRHILVGLALGDDGAGDGLGERGAEGRGDEGT
mmetsp:Transcript_44012/g.104163  ORF Transcript_44012/g.104163 Transcript_44012/m.104163 type:complete len:204 (-) Transcript_44012:951-1562(-)